VFSGYFGFSIAIHIGIRYQFLHFFWVLASGPPTIASGLPSAKCYFKPPATPLVTSH